MSALQRTCARTPRILLAAAATFGLFSCGGGGGGDSTSTVSGFVIFVSGDPAPLQEVEPDDSVDQPQTIGVLEAGRRLAVRGEIGADGDEIDAYSFTTHARVAVRARLVFEGPRPGRVQLGVFDPVGMQLVQPPLADSASFVARGSFDLVVRAQGGTGKYSLVVSTSALADGTVTAGEAGAAGGRAASLAVARASDVARTGWLGGLLAGDAIGIASRGPSTWTATCVEDQDLVVRVPAGASVTVRDRSRDTSVTVSGGEQRIELAALARVELSTDDAAPFRFEIETRAPSAGAAVRGPVHAADPADERIAWSAGPADPLYGRTLVEAMPGRVLVRAHDGADLSGEIARRACTVQDVIPGIAQLVATERPVGIGSSERARTTVALARAFAASPRVEYAELDFIRHAQGSVTPNDTYFNPQYQWHYPMIRLPQAWGVFTGATNTIVAVLDTGQRPHPDLTPNLVTGYDFISDIAMAGDGDGRDPDPFDEGDGQGPAPSTFHGTHVAGTIAAVTNNATGIAGVCGPANRTRVMHLRVLGIGGGSDADIAQAVLYAAGLPNSTGTMPSPPANIINLSLGGPVANATVQNAINSAVGAGVTVFAAAGNQNSPVAFYPAAFNNVISISAIDINSAKAPYSNFHATVDLCAPGGDTTVDVNGDTYPDGVLSTLVDQMGMPIYAFYQGTSMACPHAAGVAALMHSQTPTLTPAQIEAKLKATAFDLGAPGADSIYGTGRIDAYQALVSAGAGTLASAPALSVLPASITFGSEDTERTFQVINSGGGALDVGTITSNAAWLTVTPIAETDGTSDVGAVKCVVDRTGLADGNYTTTVTVNADNGTVPVRVVAVSMSVVPAPVLVDVDIHVLIIDATTFETVREAVVNPTTGLAFAFADLPRGDYYLYAGSDEDPSDGICGPNDLYCGAYPTLDQPAQLHLDGQDLSFLHFVVGPMASTRTGAVAHVYSRREP